MVADQRFPSLASIRAFEAAARLGSFSGAARELGTSAASVSYHVRQLEQQIGVPLFHRLPHRVELTEPGEVVANEAISAFAGLRASFARAVEVEETRLTLTALPTFGTSWLAPRLGRLRARHPELMVELDLSVETQELGAGRFDAAFRNGHGNWRGLRCVALFPSIFMPLCAPALMEAATRLTDPGQSPSVPLLGRHDWWAIWFNAQGLDAPPLERFGTRLSAEHLDIAAATAGHGIAIGSPILFATEIAAGGLVPAHDFVASDGRSFWLCYPIARQASRKLAMLREWVSEEAVGASRAAKTYIARSVGAA